jgi:hypothetical protein
VDCEGPTIADLLRADMRNPGLPKVAIFGVTSRDQLPSAKQLRPHPAPSFEADTFAFALSENDLDLNRILKLLDPQCIVTIGDMPSFESTCGALLHLPRVDSHGQRRRPAWHRHSELFLARCCRNTKASKRFAK